MIRFKNITNCCLFLISISVHADEPKLSQTTIRETIEKSIPFLEREGEAWIEKRGCVSCHQIPFMVWSLDAAAQRGFALNDKLLVDRKSWSTEIMNFSNPKNDSERSESEIATVNLDTMTFLLLALGNDHRFENSDWRAKFATFLVDNQHPEGHWNPCGQLPFQKRPKPETQDITTMWTLLALLRSGQVDSFKTGPQAVTEKFQEAGESTEWWAARLLLAEEMGDDTVASQSRQKLISTQHDDGGWGWLIENESDAFGTGVAVYALVKAGVSHEHESIVSGLQFLKRTQAEDGSWPVKSTKAKHQKQVTPTATYWGTAWAVIAMCESLVAE